MSTGVSKISINVGDSDMETGFENGRLPNGLGPIAVTVGFRFGIQIEFTLDNIDSTDVVVKRTAVFYTDWTDPLSPKLKNVSPRLTSDEIKASTNGKVDNPNTQNIKIDGNRIIVFDGPGPTNSIVVNNKDHYPIKFMARFKLMLIHRPSDLTIAIADYYLEVEKKQINTKPSGIFEALSLTRSQLATSIVQSGGFVSAPTFRILEVVSNKGQMAL